MTEKINHHLDPATLMAFSAGSLGEALSAVAAAHIEMCEECRTDLRDLDMMGSLLLDGIACGPGSAPRGRPTRPLGDVVTLAPRNRRAPAATALGEAPPVAIALKYSIDLTNVAWRRLGPGVWHHRLPLSAGVKGDLRLLKIAAGRCMPEHGHGGTELTLVLDGAYQDESGRYGAGDIQDIDGDSEHRPIADPETGCICIVASERPAKFKDVMSKLLQPLTGM